VAYAAALAERNTRGPLIFVLNAAGTLTLVRQCKMGIAGAAIGTLGADVTSTLFLLDQMCRARQKTAAEDGKGARPLLVVPSRAGCQRGGSRTPSPSPPTCRWQRVGEVIVGGGESGENNGDGGSDNMARTSGIACLVLGSMLLTAYVALYLRKQRSRMGRNNGAGGVGKEGDANNNQM
jgi:hypothetical protein